MNFHYGIERRKFIRRWEKLRSEYEAAGMSEAAIQQMYDYDWEELKRERIFRMHNYSIEDTLFPDSDMASEEQYPLSARHPDRFSVHQPSISEWSRYDWVEDIDTPELAAQIKALSPADLELLSCLIVDGISRAELARQLDVSRTSITKKLNRIKKNLEKN